MLKYIFEIKNRLFLLTITFFSTALVCYLYKEVLLFLITQIYLSNPSFYFIFTDVTELFSVYFKLVMFFTVQITFWYLFYHVFVFFCPALYFYEYKFVSFFVKVITFFCFFSIFLSNYIVIPLGWRFFLGFQSQQTFYFEARLTEYFDFYNNVYFLCLIYCQLFTIAFFFLADVNYNYMYIKKYRKIYYFMFVFFATLISPPDVISQVVISFFVIVIYEIILLLFILKLFIKLS